MKKLISTSGVAIIFIASSFENILIKLEVSHGLSKCICNLTFFVWSSRTCSYRFQLISRVLWCGFWWQNFWVESVDENLPSNSSSERIDLRWAFQCKNCFLFFNIFLNSFSIDFPRDFVISLILLKVSDEIIFSLSEPVEFLK